MANYLEEAIIRLGNEGARSVMPHERTRYKTSFMLSCAIRLCVRLRERLAETLRNSGTIKTEAGTTLPALASLYDQTNALTARFMSDNLIFTRNTNINARSSHSLGQSDGRAAGDRISLNSQIGGTRAAGHLIGKG